MLRHRGPNAKCRPRRNHQHGLDEYNLKCANVEEDVAGTTSAESFPFRDLLPMHSEELMNSLNDEKAENNLNGIRILRAYLCLEEISVKRQSVLELNILGRLRDFLFHPSEEIQYETCWVLTNIAAGQRSDIQAMLDAFLVKPLISLVQFSVPRVQAQAAWVLGNIAGEGLEFCQLLLKEGVMDSLLYLAPSTKETHQSEDSSRRQVACWLISNICRWGIEDWQEVQKCFDLLEDTLLFTESDDVRAECFWALSRIFQNQHECTVRFLNANVCFHLLEASKIAKPHLQTPALSAISNISATPRYIDELIRFGLLHIIHFILRFRDNFSTQSALQVLNILANITSGNAAQKSHVVDLGMFEELCSILSGAEQALKQEAILVFRNAVDCDAMPDHFRLNILLHLHTMHFYSFNETVYYCREIVGWNGELFKPLTAFISNSYDHPKYLLPAVETLNIIFSRGNEPAVKSLYNFADPNINIYVSSMFQLDPQNFENLWSAYQKARVNGDDLTTLLSKCSVAERSGPDAIPTRVQGTETGIFRPDHIAPVISTPSTSTIQSDMAAFVKEQRLRRRIAADLEKLMQTHLKSHTDVRLGMDGLVDDIVTSMRLVNDS
ncbi:Importin alpha subunit (Karyopherin alpha subunit) (Serine-rich RNA polymerase I suppressor protein) [Phlyctochytrium planicorne]|nr:Importin alpha subunit (Karyopherin alpha subunit) (Serine-rich RNA polymerase I suppressor protein) [Phlyctochytrium planicorne]